MTVNAEFHPSVQPPWLPVPAPLSSAPSPGLIDHLSPPKARFDRSDFTIGVNFLPRCLLKVLRAVCYCTCFCFSRIYLFSLSLFRRLFSPFDVTFGGALQQGSVNQSNVVHRDVLRLLSPGSITCTYVSAAAAEATLREDVNVDLVVVRGVGRALNHYGVHIDPSFFSIEDEQVAMGRLQEIVSGLDAEDPALLDRILQSQSVFESWDEGAEGAFPHLESAIGLSEVIENYPGLQGRLTSEATASSQYAHSLETFARSIAPGSVGAALLTSPPNTYTVSIRKNTEGEIEKISFFDSHGCDQINPSYYSGAYLITWARDNSREEVTTRAANFLSWMAPYRSHALCHYSLSPLRTL